MKVNESYLRNIVSRILKESVFGISGKQVEGWGGKNPIDDYPIDFAEVKQKAEAFRDAIKAFSTFIDGVEDDAESGVEGNRGLKTTLSLRAFWRDDDDLQDSWTKEDETYFSDELGKVSKNLYSTLNTINELIDYCNENAQ